MTANEIVVRDANEEALELWIEKYGDSPWVKSMVASLPVVGSFLDSHFGSMANDIYQRRIDSLLNEINSELSSLKDKSIDSSYLESEEFFDLSQNAFSRAAKISDIDRTSAIARIISDSILGRKNTSTPEFDLINVVGEMSPSEALMFGEIGKIYLYRKDLLTGKDSTLFVVEDIKLALPKTLQNNAEFLCARLVSKGVFSSMFENYGLEIAGEELLRYFQSQYL
ncbi:hypothetical protein L4C34_10020 [Vibrio profundum]|uniref:hypothetical protein n=1 Tax=Vibrio profundum TaxID=2910247 RepID=UPI003D0B5639